MKPASIFAYMAFACLIGAAMPEPAAAAAWPPHGVAHQRYAKGVWRLDVARDRFTGAIACRLQAHGGRQLYRSGAVGFAVGARNAWDAAYRLDSGEAVAARGNFSRLMALHVPVDRGGLDDSTTGYVWIPFEQLTHSSAVAIEPSAGANPKVLRLAGLVPLHDLALQRGCIPEAAFVGK